MTVPVQLNLTVLGANLDYVNQTLTVTFSLSKFGTPQTATLELGNDFSTAQLQGNQGQMEALFQKWVQRQ